MAQLTDYPELPAFLRIPQEERRECWKGRKLTVQGRSFRRVDKEEDNKRKRLYREFLKQKAEREAARLKFLKEHY